MTASNLESSPVRIAGEVLPKPPNKLQMGLQRLDPKYWLIKDTDFDDQIGQKRPHLQQSGPKVRNQVLQVLPQSAEAQAELLDFVIDFQQHQTNSINADLPPIEQASLMAQEDFCILELQKNGLYTLTAACVCFPSRWDLPSKLGRSLDQIHDPVPGFQAALASPLNRMFANLQVENPVWRQNWALETDPDLHQPGTHFHDRGGDLTPTSIGEKLWLRSEYQTLRRLPETNAIVFTIRNFIWPLKQILNPDHLLNLREQINTMSPDMADYKSVTAYKQAILTYLNYGI